MSQRHFSKRKKRIELMDLDPFHNSRVILTENQGLEAEDFLMINYHKRFLIKTDFSIQSGITKMNNLDSNFLKLFYNIFRVDKPLSKNIDWNMLSRVSTQP